MGPWVDSDRGEPATTSSRSFTIAGEPSSTAGKGAFCQTDLELMLRNRGIETLLCAGDHRSLRQYDRREANDRGFFAALCCRTVCSYSRSFMSRAGDDQGAESSLGYQDRVPCSKYCQLSSDELDSVASGACRIRRPASTQGAALHSKYSLYDFILIINQRVGWSPAGRSRAPTHENFLVTDRKDFV